MHMLNNSKKVLLIMIKMFVELENLSSFAKLILYKNVGEFSNDYCHHSFYYFICLRIA
ncbi:hypothetical protein CCAND95_220009 [Capnocytophaga canis]|uniref:Uncharacterized protein n=1 Tax=Capnocytophaga canis TaxID=1848903 RepID=A0A0B7HXF6_9FLAO|nr:hypothetical protein CCAND95_220009 [Capnocytophaga canis]CEN47658.1 hypothetical protein CCAND38_460009 [Capnocytophaga canis]CEN53606.1 hypothetical protein CCAND93_490022 [Capnocytophaga canis]